MTVKSSLLVVLIHSLQQLHFLPGTPTAANEHDLALARQFFDGNTPSSADNLPFAVGHRLPPLSMARIAGGSGFEQKEAWSIEQQDQIRTFGDPKVNATWATEFGNAPSVAQHHMGTQADSTLSTSSHQPQLMDTDSSAKTILPWAYVSQRYASRYVRNGHGF